MSFFQSYCNILTTLNILIFIVILDLFVIFSLRKWYLFRTVIFRAWNLYQFSLSTPNLDIETSVESNLFIELFFFPKSE